MKPLKTTADYVILEKLDFRVIRKKGDNFYPILNEDKQRRNLGMKATTIIQSTLFELSELCLLSRIHFNNCNIMKISLEIAKEEKGPFIPVERDLLIVSGKKRILKVGSLPCKFFRIKVKEGSQLMKYGDISCYGMKHDSLKKKFDDETLELILYNTFSFLYD